MQETIGDYKTQNTLYLLEATYFFKKNLLYFK